MTKQNLTLASLPKTLSELLAIPELELYFFLKDFLEIGTLSGGKWVFPVSVIDEMQNRGRLFTMTTTDIYSVTFSGIKDSTIHHKSLMTAVIYAAVWSCILESA